MPEKVSLIIAKLTLKRYSTARSGLKNAARIARSISARSKPMLSMFSIAAARSLPIVSADGSLKVRSVAVPAPAGDGVAGAFVVAVDAAAGAGAAGAAGATGV